MLSIEKTSYNEKDVWQECHEACTQQPRGAHRPQHSNQSDSLASHVLLGPPSMPHPVMQVPEQIWKNLEYQTILFICHPSFSKPHKTMMY